MLQKFIFYPSFHVFATATHPEGDVAGNNGVEIQYGQETVREPTAISLGIVISL